MEYEEDSNDNNCKSTVSYPKNLRKEITIQKFSNNACYSTIEVNRNSEESAGDLLSLDPKKDHQLHLMQK